MFEGIYMAGEWGGGGGMAGAGLSNNKHPIIPTGDNSNAMPSQFDWNFSRFIFFDDILNEMTRLIFWEKQANSTNPSSANFVFSMLNVKIGHKTE